MATEQEAAEQETKFLENNDDTVVTAQPTNLSAEDAGTAAAACCAMCACCAVLCAPCIACCACLSCCCPCCCSDDNASNQ